MPIYDVIFAITGTARIQVEAENEDDAILKAFEKADDGLDVEDAEIDDVWDVSVAV